MTTLVFPFLPNWDSEVKETQEFLTVTHQFRDGRERRRALRAYPRVTISGTMLEKDHAPFLRDRIQMLSSKELVGVPVWHDMDMPIASTIATSCQIPISDGQGTTREPWLQAGQSACLLYPNNPMFWYSATVAEVNDSFIVMGTTIGHVWEAGKYVVAPLALGRITDFPKEKWYGSALEAEVSFDLYHNNAFEGIGANTTFRTYAGTPVLSRRPNVDMDKGEETFKRLITMDSGYGSTPLVIDVNPDIMYSVMHMGFLFTTREGVLEFKRFWWSRRGSQKWFWLPTWDDNFKLVKDLTLGDTTLDVVATNYIKDSMYQNLSTKYIQIENPATGSCKYTQITGGSYVTVDGVRRMRLNLSGSVPWSVKKESVKLSFLVPARFTDDKMEITWYTNGVAEVSISAKSIPEIVGETA